MLISAQVFVVAVLFSSEEKFIKIINVGMEKMHKFYGKDTPEGRTATAVLNFLMRVSVLRGMCATSSF